MPQYHLNSAAMRITESAVRLQVFLTTQMDSNPARVSKFRAESDAYQQQHHSAGAMLFILTEAFFLVCECDLILQTGVPSFPGEKAGIRNLQYFLDASNSAEDLNGLCRGID